ncbi:dihydrodipicolinate synthase family protein [Streptomyces sp. NPDC058700]|uniref:dihydrodipicolinate synthase family protein n=1 Tax=Streptomyces sp. NPDC058700 TaxID=3346607 RepID=UPI00364D2C88
MVATTLPLRGDGSVDHDAYARHVSWLIAQGCDGVVPNGSLGEYQTLTDAERAQVVRTAVEAAGDGSRVMPGVSAYGGAEALRWAEQAAEAGAGSVLLLPPNAYRADERSVRAHFAQVAGAGLPVVAYNNPFDTKVDLTPALLARLHADGSIVAVKEFSGDVRRAYEIAELAPGLDLLVGADDVLLELVLAGAVGWVAGYPNAFPRTCATLYRAAVAGDLDTAVPLYKSLHGLFRWDSKVEFVQAIKLSMDVAGRTGGPTRAPRLPLTPEQETAVRAATEKALAEGHA